MNSGLFCRQQKVETRRDLQQDETTGDEVNGDVQWKKPESFK